MQHDKINNLVLIWPFLIAFFLGCESSSFSNADGDSGPLDSDFAPSDSDEPTETDSEQDVDSGSEDEKETEPPEPEPPEPCAEQVDADRILNSDVNQVSGVVVPDLGDVPEGEPFEGSLEKDGCYDVFTQAVKIPIEKGTLTAAGYTISVEAGTLSGTVYAPSNNGGNTIAEGSFPLVLVLSGFQMSYNLYSTYANHLASHGFAVLGFDTRSEFSKASHDKESFEIVQTLDWIEEADTPLKGKVDLTKIAVAGHSKGGKLGFFTAAIDHRIDLVIAWDPANSGGPPCSFKILGECNAYPVAPNCEADDPGLLHLMRAETLVLGMPRDILINPDKHHNSIHFYRGAPSPASLVYYDAGHAATILNSTVIKLNKQIQLALLLNRFKGVPNLSTSLPCSPEGAKAIKKNDIVTRVESK